MQTLKQSVTELIGVILQRLEEHPDAQPTESKMRSWLQGQGYSKRDIDAAIKLIAPRFTPPAGHSEPRSSAIRHLSPYEAFKMSPAARAALARLELADLIEPHEREAILERLAQFDGEVSMEDLDYLISWIVCPTRDVETQQTLFSVFEDSREDVVH